MSVCRVAGRACGALFVVTFSVPGEFKNKNISR
jgi:hypothetical protein